MSILLLIDAQAQRSKLARCEIQRDLARSADLYLHCDMFVQFNAQPIINYAFGNVFRLNEHLMSF